MNVKEFTNNDLISLFTKRNSILEKQDEINRLFNKKFLLIITNNDKIRGDFKFCGINYDPVINATYFVIYLDNFKNYRPSVLDLKTIFYSDTEDDLKILDEVT